MPTITLTLTDTPNGAVSIHSSFKPAVGNPCSPAQAAALEMINRTHKQWGVHIDAAPGGFNPAEVRRPGLSERAQRIALDNPSWCLARCVAQAKNELTHQAQQPSNSTSTPS